MSYALVEKKNHLVTYDCLVDWGENWESEQYFRRLLHSSDGKFYLKSTKVIPGGIEKKFENEMKEIIEAEAEEIFNKRKKFEQYWENLITKKRKKRRTND